MRHMRIAVFLSLFFIPIAASAQVIITEIMYDLEGADKGREWIEVQNISEEDVDISAWRFFESDTNHNLEPVLGSGVLAPEELAIIADKEMEFQNDRPDFSGSLFDSSFSLKNTGESLTLRNAELNDVDTVVYTSEWGAGGDGNSLQLSGGEWVAQSPTPGKKTAASSPNSGSEETEQSSDTLTGSEGRTGGTRPAPPSLDAFITNAPRHAVVGASVLFAGSVLGIAGEPLSGARFVWAFGDGSRTEGEKVLHTFSYPGTYLVSLNVSSGQYSGSDRVEVEAIEPELAIASVGPASDFFVTLENNSDYELDLSNWLLVSGDSFFQIPSNTFILPRTAVRFSQSVTGLSAHERGDLKLLYPSGDIAYQFSTADSQKREDTNTESLLERKTNVAPNPQATEPSLTSAGKAPLRSEYDRERSGANEAQAAVLAGQGELNSTGTVWKWLFALSLIVLVGVAGVLVTRSNRSLADEFEITEEK